MLPHISPAGVYDAALAYEERQHFFKAAAAETLPAVLANIPEIDAALDAIFGSSPYLTRLLARNADLVLALGHQSPEELMQSEWGEIEAAVRGAPTNQAAMQTLRRAKQRGSLLVALAELGGLQPFEINSRALALLAETLICAAVRRLLDKAVADHNLTITDTDRPEAESGLIVLAMGKLGGFELNYSSDVDLIIFFDRERASLRCDQWGADFFIRLTQRLIALLNMITADGIVYRVDLRLRPDPASTPVALSTTAALHYYETGARDWERAAFIKARPLIADRIAAQHFLDEITPFVWRRYLDFDTVEAIRSMKSQVHLSHRARIIPSSSEQPQHAGINVKLSVGGIRDIEFLVQAHQLLAGGRHRELRRPDTLAMIAILAEKRWISTLAADELAAAYRFLRSVEDRLQMVHDQQTHTLPHTISDYRRIAILSGFADNVTFDAALSQHIAAVRRHSDSLFEPKREMPSTTADPLIACFGDQPDPAMITALHELGFKAPEKIAAGLCLWLDGTIAATAEPRARSLITLLAPQLIRLIAETGHPDTTFRRFNSFFVKVKAGTQLLSFLEARPVLMRLLIDIADIAPRLSDQLTRHINLLDDLINDDYLTDTTSTAMLAAALEANLADAVDFSTHLDHMRLWVAEQKFRIGMQLLVGTISARRAGRLQSRLASVTIRAALEKAGSEEKSHARHSKITQTPKLVVLAFGRLGEKIMTPRSDLDLVVIHDEAPERAIWLTRRMIAILASPTPAGSCFQVDMRLRPSGRAGSAAVTFAAFVAYHREKAWSWETMALVKARIVAGDINLAQHLKAAIQEQLRQPRDQQELARDVVTMRARIMRDKKNERRKLGTWHPKHAPGGLITAAFLCQYLLLVHIPATPEIFTHDTALAFRKMARLKILPAEEAEALARAWQRFQAVDHILSLCLDAPFEAETAPPALLNFLARGTGVAQIEQLKSSLNESQNRVAAAFEKRVCAIANVSWQDCFGLEDVV